MDARALVERLRANAAIFAAQVAGVSEDEARWKPDPAQWSILEVVNHLGDEEVEDFRTRLDFTLHRPGEPWPKIDPPRWAVERGYNQRSLAESIERFRQARVDTVDWLEALDAPDWNAAYRHPKFGPITAGDLLTAWVGHDYIHVRQINRLQRAYLVSVLSEHSAAYAGTW
jgi:hypothetical protein